MANKLILMRGCPGSGKSYRAKELAGDTGLIFSTDEYFYTQVNTKEPEVYNFNPNFLDKAHKWNFVRATMAINEQKPLVIIDNTNIKSKDFCCTYMRYAHFQGYEIEFQEPTSEIWQEIREFLQDDRNNRELLAKYSQRLSELNSHGVPPFAIERMLLRWQFLNPQTVLENCLENCNPKNTVDSINKNFEFT